MNPQDIISGFNLSFDQGVAIECGVNPAIVFNHICYWLQFNENNPEAIKNGKVWMYEKQSHMSDFFRFFSEKAVRGYIKILIDKGLIIKDNFNDSPFIHTNWYSLPDSIYQKVLTKRQFRLNGNSPAVSSEETNSSLLNKEEILRKEKELLPKASKPSPLVKGVVVFSSLGKLDIPESLMEKITRDYEEADVNLAVERCLKWKGRSNDEVGILTALKQKDCWKDVETSEEAEEKNRTLLKMLEKYDGKTITNTKIVIGNGYLEMSRGMLCEHFLVTSKTFLDEMVAFLPAMKKLIEKEVGKC